MSLAQLNSLSRDEFVRIVGPVFEQLVLGCRSDVADFTLANPRPFMVASTRES